MRDGDARQTKYTAHTDEHYGNMVTYLRIKGIVPRVGKDVKCKGG
jgi:hypothetical protein